MDIKNSGLVFKLKRWKMTFSYGLIVKKKSFKYSLKKIQELKKDGKALDIGFGAGLVFLAGLAFLLSGITVGGQLVQWDVSTGFSTPTALLRQLGNCLLFAVQCFLPVGWHSARPAGIVGTLIATGLGVAGVTFAMVLIVAYVKRGMRE